MIEIPSTAELVYNDILELRKLRTYDRLTGDNLPRYSKIGHALMVLSADLDKMLVLRHTNNAHDNVSEGMIGPVAETYSAVCMTDHDLWRPETRLEVAVRSLQEEIGLGYEQLGLQKPSSGTDPGLWRFTMEWPMGNPNIPKSIGSTFGVCTIMRATNESAIEAAVCDPQEVDSVEWIPLREVGDMFASDEGRSKFRPGVLEWWALAGLRAYDLRSDNAGFEEIVNPRVLQQVADIRFNDQECMQRLGMS